VSVKTDAILDYANRNPEALDTHLLDRITRAKSTIYAAARIRGMDTDFLDEYISSVESRAEFEHTVINWLKDIDALPVEPLEKEELRSFKEKRLSQLFEERIAPYYGLERLFKFLFRGDWLFVYNTIHAAFIYKNLN